MDKNETELFSFINNYLQTKLNNLKIKNMKWDAIHYSYQNIPKESKYDELTLMEFFTLYKIDRLVKLNIISNTIAQGLKDLFYLKLNLKTKLEALLSDINNLNQNQDLINHICEKEFEIDAIFKKYNLVTDKLDLENVMDSIILGENYKNLNQNMELYRRQFKIYNELANQEEKDTQRTIDFLDTLIEKNGKTK